jgi:uncharacterized protein YutE (UPF0331/DUF86 family)
LNLERVIQECVDIALHIISEDNSIPVPDNMAQAFLTLRQMNIISAETAQNLAKAVGFRKIAIHAYRQIDWQIVYQIITSKLDDFKKSPRRLPPIGKSFEGSLFWEMIKMGEKTLAKINPVSSASARFSLP